MSSLKVPDAKALSFVQELCDREVPYEDFARTDELFVKAMKQNLAWHAERSPFYKKLLESERERIGELRTVADCARIPAVPANFFKFHEVLSIPRDSVYLHLTSSGTTGQKSQIFFDEWSLGTAQEMIDKIFASYGWIESSLKANYLLYSYEPQSGFKVGTSYTDNFLCKYAPVESVFYSLRSLGGKGHDFDPFGTLEALRRFAEQGLPVRIFGFPAFLHFTLERMETLGMEPLKLHPKSLVFLGGGWKTNANRSIPKLELYANVNRMLGIPDDRIRDGFGSVEHCIPYIECKNHNFHVPVWSRIFVRDRKTLEPLPEGEKGFLNFVSPYITSVPAQSVLMGDIASWHGPKSCGCGLPTPYFVLHGRAGTSASRSCAVAASEFLEKK